MKTDHRLHCSPQLYPSTLTSLCRLAAGVCMVVNSNLCGAGGCEAGERCRTRRMGRNMILVWQSRARELNEMSSVHQCIWNSVTGFRFLKQVTGFKTGYRLTGNRLTALVTWQSPETFQERLKTFLFKLLHYDYSRLFHLSLQPSRLATGWILSNLLTYLLLGLAVICVFFGDTLLHRL